MSSNNKPETYDAFEKSSDKQLDTEGRVAKMMQGVKEKVAKHGHIIQLVTGEESFSYSVGRSPDYEVFTAGCSEIIGQLLNEVIGMLKSETVSIVEGVPFTSEIAAVSIDSVEHALRVKYMIATAPQNELINSEYGHVANIYSENPKWIILHTGDFNNLLPGEEGFVEKVPLMLELAKVDVLH